MKNQRVFDASSTSCFLRTFCVAALLLTLGACGSSGGNGNDNGSGNGNGSGNSGGNGSGDAPEVRLLGVLEDVHGSEPWKTDGTADGTVMVKDINPAPGVSSVGSDFTPFKGAFYFKGNDGVHGSELWKTDGTDAGTVMVKDINPATEPLFDPATGQTSGPEDFTVFNGALYFATDDGTNGYELWKTDGTADGTVMLKDINPTAGAGSFPAAFIVFNGNLYFHADDGEHGDELWRTDGTADGTVMVKDINEQPGMSSFPSHLIVLNDRLYFTADDAVHDKELWKTDGTSDGTVMVKDINTATTSGSMILEPAVFHNALYFQAFDGVNGSELWKSDGTADGTVMVKDIYPGGSSSPAGLVVFNDALYFNADDGVNGREPWKSDGTEAGTAMVKDINPGAQAASLPYGFTAFNGALYFRADDGAHDMELWKTNGTSDGTVLVKDINMAGGSSIYNFMVLNGGLYFIADDGVNGKALWKTDGTDAGTHLVKDFCPDLCVIPTPPVNTRSVALPKTGHTTCTDDSGTTIDCAGTGQDGELQTGVAWPAPRFSVDSTGDCMTDNLTGLMWQRNPAASGTWQEALDYSNNLDACGFTDWRLPNRKELRSLINYATNSMAWLLDQGFGNLNLVGGGLYAGDHWTSSSVAANPTDAWMMILINGVLFPEVKTESNAIWAVRAGN